MPPDERTIATLAKTGIFTKCNCMISNLNSHLLQTVMERTNKLINRNRAVLRELLQDLFKEIQENLIAFLIVNIFSIVILLIVFHFFQNIF